MESNLQPREYEEWREDIWSRKEDAANTFGLHLMKYCREQAIENLSKEINKETRENAIESIDIALHNVMDLIEGFWKLESGQDHFVEYQLNVKIKDKNHSEIEKISIAPGLDLPIGFWNWVNGKFRQ
jgi:hypothetical protein